MNSVSLVCTVHEEAGLASSPELHAILAGIRPEVIFLEVPPAAFHDYYVSCSRKNLESSAVRQYRESGQAKLVPVDLPTPEREFFENTGYMRRSVWDASPEYRQLIRLDSAYLSRYGFAYLNSDHCSKLWFAIYEEMSSTIRKMDDSRLVELYELWNATNDSREDEMMKNVLKYCIENTFDKSVFLVGAAHRQRIIDKSRKQTAVDSTKIRWDFPSCMSPT